MDREAIIEFITGRGEIEIALAQEKFNLKYSQAKELIDELVAKGTLAYEGGVKYVVVKKQEQEQKQPKDGRSGRRFMEVEPNPFLFNFDCRMVERGRRAYDKDDDKADETKDEAKDEDNVETKVDTKAKPKGKTDTNDSTRTYTETPPPHDTWKIRSLFKIAVERRFDRLVRSDKSMSRQGAIKKAQTWLEAVEDTSYQQLYEIYARVLFELQQMSDYAYNKYKKKLFEE